MNMLNAEHRRDEMESPALRVRKPSDWQDRLIPPRDWIVDNRILARSVTLLSGEGGAGKGILMTHLATATVLGADWLGSTPKRGPVVYLSAEEEEEEFHRRLLPIVDHYGATLSELKDLHTVCMAGLNAVLGEPHEGIIKPTSLYDKFRRYCAQVRPTLIVIENSADVYAGQENDRKQVRQFVTLLRALAIESNAGLLLSAHPSLTGINSGSGLSGSTAWHNSVRARMLLKPQGAEVRTLSTEKNNYGPLAPALTLKWQNGLFLPVNSSGVDQTVRREAEADVDRLFMALLTKLTANGRSVTDKAGTSYAPAILAKCEGARGVTKQALAMSMQRLLHSGRIRIETFGPPSRTRTRLVAQEVQP